MLLTPKLKRITYLLFVITKLDRAVLFVVVVEMSVVTLTNLTDDAELSEGTDIAPSCLLFVLRRPLL